MHLLATLLLLLALLPLWLVLRGRRGEPPPGPRYQRMVRAHWLRFGLPPVLLLGVSGQWAAFWRLPADFAPAAALLGVNRLSAEDRWYLIGAVAVGVTVGVLFGTVLTAWRAWRGRPEGTLLGDARHLLPHGRDELGWAAAVAVTAGVTEEAYFRLLLPLLGTQAFGSAVGAFAGATLLFGAAHRYQGWRGVAATTVAGGAMAAGYLATGSLIAVMAFHAAGDLGHFVIRPAVRGWVERRRSPLTFRGEERDRPQAGR